MPELCCSKALTAILESNLFSLLDQIVVACIYLVGWLGLKLNNTDRTISIIQFSDKSRPECGYRIFLDSHFGNFKYV